MPPTRLLAPWCVALLLLAGACAKHEAPVSSVAAAMQVQQVGAATLPSAERAMRITVETSLEVADLGAAAAAVRAAVTRHGGYVGEARTTGGDGGRTASFEVHVPVADLPAFRREIAELGDVTSDSEKAEDVTEQRADIKARLSNARAEEKRLLELLDKQAGSLADVVAVEKELAAVRETIERMEAQERVLEGQIATATVRIQVYVRSAAGGTGPGRRIARAFGEGLENAGSFLVGLAVLVMSAGPTLLILAVLGYGVFRVVRFFRRRARATPAAR
jgi:hypothetical protein